MTRNYSKVTLNHLQQTQPWTIPYSDTLSNSVAMDNGLGHLLGTHAALHASKTLGQISAIFENLDHTGKPISEHQKQELANKAADLVTAAMRLGNLYGFDLAKAVVERSEEKNGVTLPVWEGA